MLALEVSAGGGEENEGVAEVGAREEAGRDQVVPEARPQCAEGLTEGHAPRAAFTLALGDEEYEHGDRGERGNEGDEEELAKRAE